ncbi:MAG: cation-transporting P-type ATPase, partial [Clostridium sp.]|nr:cation-transporting P-type ATPase [Clostridium sp.]
MKEYYQKSWTKVVELLGSNVYKGLIEYECILRRERYGDNKVTIPNKKSVKRSLMDKAFSWTSIIYISVAILFIIKKKYLFLSIELAVYILGLVHTAWYSSKNKKNIELLSNLNTIDVTVIREGVERIVRAEELVIGDIVIFKENSFISADLRIISSQDLKVDERSITGDKMLKDKYEAMIDHNVGSLSDISNILYRGSIIKKGSGSGVVIATGMNTYLGNLLSSLDKYKLKKSLGFKELDGIIGKINLICILITIILSVIIPGKSAIRQDVLLSCIFISSSLIYPIIYYVYDKNIIKELQNEEIYLNNIFALNDSEEVKVLFIEK